MENLIKYIFSYPSICRNHKKLEKLTKETVFIEEHIRTKENYFKISNEFTKIDSDKILLCKVSEGIKKAMKMAVTRITKIKTKWDNLPINKQMSK